MNSLLIKMVLLTLCQTQIYYDGGTNDDFDLNACDVGSSKTKKISFSGTF